MYTEIGRKLYFDKITGSIIVDTGERQGHVRETTIEEDFSIYKALHERVPETIGVSQLEYGQYTQDFMECNGYRVNPETLQIEFSYLDPNLPPEEQEPEYRKPLSEEVKELREETMGLQTAMAELTMMLSTPQ